MDNKVCWKRKASGTAKDAQNSTSYPDRQYYQIPIILRLAKRVTALSAECKVCQGLQNQIINLSTDLADLPGRTNQSFKGYLGIVKNIIKHLKRTHRLVEERQYIKRYVLIGLTFGLSLVLLCLILLNFGITLLTLNVALLAMVTRIIIGYVIGFFLDKRAKKLGKVL